MKNPNAKFGTIFMVVLVIAGLAGCAKPTSPISVGKNAPTVPRAGGYYRVLNTTSNPIIIEGNKILRTQIESDEITPLAIIASRDQPITITQGETKIEEIFTPVPNANITLIVSQNNGNLELTTIEGEDRNITGGIVTGYVLNLTPQDTIEATINGKPVQAPNKQLTPEFNLNLGANEAKFGSESLSFDTEVDLSYTIFIYESSTGTKIQALRNREPKQVPFGAGGS